MRVEVGEGDVVMMATSRDGLRWEKPSLGIFQFDGTRNNNIVFDIHSPSVILDARDPDPAKRYKMLGSFEGGYWAAHSPDGLHWKSYAKNPVLPHSDTITLTQDAETGEYLAFHKRPATVRGLPRRVVWLAASRDFVNWSEPRMILPPDEEDDRFARSPEQRMEFYMMSAFCYGGQYLGLISALRVTGIRPRERVAVNQSPVDGPVDIQLVHSRDGRAWTRFADRSAIIPCGPPGSYDAGMILGVANSPVLHGDEVWVYYTAYNTLDGGAAGGFVETVPLDLGARRLEVNAEAARGRLRVAALAADGRPLPGFALEGCEPLRGDGVRQAVRWRGGAVLPAGRAVCLRFAVESASLYGFRVAPDSGRARR
jgi:hypothetical protein